MAVQLNNDAISCEYIIKKEESLEKSITKNKDEYSINSNLLVMPEITSPTRYMDLEDVTFVKLEMADYEIVNGNLTDISNFPLMSDFFDVQRSNYNNNLLMELNDVRVNLADMHKSVCVLCHSLLNLNKTQHVRYDSMKNIWQLECARCYQVSNLDVTSQKHGPFECRKCGSKFRSKICLGSHIFYEHTQLTDINYETLRNNVPMKRPNGVHKKKTCFVCSKCFKSFRQIQHLNRHTKLVHKKFMPFKCSRCGRRFGLKENLSRHINCVHLKPQNLKQQNLKLKHDGSFICDVCRKKYRFKCNLKRHLYSIHYKVLKLSKSAKKHCHICNRAFVAGYDLKKHVDIVHNNIRKFKCGPCDRRFGTKGNLNKHIIKYHDP